MTMASMRADPGQDDIGYIAQHGYGLAVHADDVASQQQPDENRAYRRALSPAAAAAYDTAREGVYAGMSDDDPGADEPWDWQKAGCTGKVTTELFPQYADAASRPYPTTEFQPPLEKAHSIEEEAATSVEQKRFDGKWQECMSAAGSSYADDREPYSALYDEFITLGRANPNNPNGFIWDTGSAEFTAFREKELAAA